MKRSKSSLYAVLASVAVAVFLTTASAQAEWAEIPFALPGCDDGLGVYAVSTSPSGHLVLAYTECELSEFQYRVHLVYHNGSTWCHEVVGYLSRSLFGGHIDYELAVAMASGGSAMVAVGASDDTGPSVYTRVSYFYKPAGGAWGAARIVREVAADDYDGPDWGSAHVALCAYGTSNYRLACGFNYSSDETGQWVHHGEVMHCGTSDGNFPTPLVRSCGGVGSVSIGLTGSLLKLSVIAFSQGDGLYFWDLFADPVCIDNTPGVWCPWIDTQNSSIMIAYKSSAYLPGWSVGMKTVARVGGTWQQPVVRLAPGSSSYTLEGFDLCPGTFVPSFLFIQQNSLGYDYGQLRYTSGLPLLPEAQWSLLSTSQHTKIDHHNILAVASASGVVRYGAFLYERFVQGEDEYWVGSIVETQTP